MQESIQALKSRNKSKWYGLRYDTLFKKVFQKKEHLQQFMKEIFKEEIENFWYLDKELPKENKEKIMIMPEYLI